MMEKNKIQSSFFSVWPWRKIVIWAIFLGLLFVLRDFFDIIFLTFIFSYMLEQIIQRLLYYFPKKRGTVTASVFFTLFAVLLFLSFLIFPIVFYESNALIRNIVTDFQVKNNNSKEEGLSKLTRFDSMPALPGEVEWSDTILSDLKKEPPQVQKVILDAYRGDVGNLFDSRGENNSSEASGGVPEFLNWVVLRLIGADKFEEIRMHPLYIILARRIKENFDSLLPLAAKFGGSLVNNLANFVFHFLLSILFSFIIVWDIPRMKALVRTLERSRLREAYLEIKPGIHSFAVVLGYAFQAQFFIAICNTFLTFIGLLILKVPLAPLLATIVFFCSFIPVMGVFISTVPILFLALKGPAGSLSLALFSGLMILMVHAMETYVLNPWIFGKTFKIHPLAVILILLVGEHFFGIWGLLLGVPVTLYLFHVVVLRNDISRFIHPPEKE